jgi:hypothetical protein
MISRSGASRKGWFRQKMSDASKENDRYNERIYFNETYDAVRQLRNYAIAIGKNVSDDIICRIDIIKKLPEEQQEKALLIVLRDLTKSAAPLNIYSIPTVELKEISSYRRRLLQAGMWAATAVIITAIAAIATPSFPAFRGSISLYTIIILLHGASLGLIGAVSYDLLHSSGIAIDSEFRWADAYTSRVRVALGGIYGLLFAITISWKALARQFFLDLEQKPTPELDELVLAFLPFLVGYSSVLVTGLLGKIIDAVRMVLGLERRLN